MNLSQKYLKISYKLFFLIEPLTGNISHGNSTYFFLTSSIGIPATDVSMWALNVDSLTPLCVIKIVNNCPLVKNRENSTAFKSGHQ